MASENSICIDKNGVEVSKILPQHNNPDSLIESLINLNSFDIEKKSTENGYNSYHVIHRIKNFKLKINIFFKNFKFDIERENFININLGTNIDNPYSLSLKDNFNTLTFILGIYCFEKSDNCKDVLFVSFPINDRKYSGNPSLRINISAIKEARHNSYSVWVNKANDNFTVFKPFNFQKLFNKNKNIKTPLFTSDNYINNAIKINKNKKGPPPRKKGYSVAEKNNINVESFFYIAQFGKFDVWKLGYTKDTEKRLKDFNMYIPSFEIPELDIWSLVMIIKYPDEYTAYSFEQKMLNHKNLKKYNTESEKFQCDYKIIYETINTNMWDEGEITEIS